MLRYQSYDAGYDYFQQALSQWDRENGCVYRKPGEPAEEADAVQGTSLQLSSAALVKCSFYNRKLKN